MWPVLAQFAFAAGTIVGAGIVLTKSADRIAEATGLGRIFVGSLLLAGATSLPELMVDINAIWLGQPDLAAGDLLGSSLFNLLILASVDSFFRHPRRAFSSEFGHHAQTAILSINLTALAGIGILAKVDAGFLGVSLFSWLIAGIYLIGLRATYSHVPDQGPEESKPRPKGPLARAITGFVGSAGVILLAAPYLIRAADQLAEQTGLGHSFVGTTLVALSTSLPELVTTLAAFRMGAPDLALANIFGSNTLNMALFFPLDALYPGALFSSVQSSHALTAFCVVAVSSIAVMGQMSRKREKTRLWDPSSELVVLSVLAFLYLSYRIRG